MSSSPSLHFKRVVDSMKICYVMLRFGFVSLMSALLDNLVFFLVWRASASLAISQILGRVVSVGFNYSMTRKSVFYSDQGHHRALPRYLALVLVSGTASYIVIRFLHQSLGMNPVPAKLMVESTLFVVNFAIQRIFIFKPPEESADRPRTSPILLFSVLMVLAFAVLLGVEIYGFASNPLFSQDIWYRVGLHRLKVYAAVFLVLAAPILLVIPWSFAAIMTSLLLVLTVVSVGPLPLLATSYFLISACALGMRLLRPGKADSLESQLCATLLGTGVYIFLMTLMARLPVNYSAVWGILLALPIATDFRGVWRRLTDWVNALRRAGSPSGWERAALGFLIFILVAQWLVVLTPESSFDALAVHLAVPVNIAANHRMTFEPNRFLWSVMPMGADWTYSIVYLLGGEYAARLLNFSMLLVVVGLLYGVIRRWVGPATAMLLAASFAATPMVQLVTGSLFVENLLTALVLALMIAVWRFGETGDKRFLYLAMGLGGTALATKLGSLAFVAVALPFVIIEIVRHWKSLGPRPLATCALAFALLLGAGFPTYAIAYRKTHDPIFPYHNRTFRSTIVGPSVDFDDARFRIPLNWRTLYTLTFHSSQTYEGQDGSFGFQYLVVAPLALLGLFVVTRRPARSGAALSLGVAVLVMSSQPNARYLYAALPMILVPFAALLEWMSLNLRWMYRVLVTFIVICAALDTYFLPTSSYYHKDFSLGAFPGAERERYLRDSAPIREIIAYYNLHHTRSAVLLTGESTIAGLQGDIYMNHWHQYPTVEQLRKAETVPEMFRLLESWKVEYLITHLPEPGEQVQPPSLRAFVAACTSPEYEFGDYYLARLDRDCARRGWSPAEPSTAMPPGLYDDFNPAIVMRGDWTHDETFASADQHTVSYSDTPGAEILFAFEAKNLMYVFTKAPNRGVATVTIDGAVKSTIDLYSPRIEWQARTMFCCLGPGRHLVRISVTGRKNPQSTGAFVDLDSFVVE